MRIQNWEKQLITWVQSHFMFLLFIVVSLLGLLIRFSLRHIESIDATFCLLPWYDIIESNGGIWALDTQVGNYNLLYQFLIALMTYVPLPSRLYAYKILSCIFDYLLAIVSGYIVSELTPPQQNKKGSFLIAYSLVLMSPPVFYNSAAWAQCDVIYSFWAVWGLYLMMKDRYNLSLFCLGVSLAFKLQAVFALPFFLIAWYMKKNFSILTFLWIPAALLLTALPSIILGRDPMDIIRIYQQQTIEYPQLYIGYPGFLALTANPGSEPYGAYQRMAILLTMFVLLAWASICICKKVTASPMNLLYLFFVTSYTCVFFLPSMHERYGFLYEAVAILIAVLDKKTWNYFAALLVLELSIYSPTLIGYSHLSLGTLAIANGCIYYLYSRHILRQICPVENTVSADYSPESA